MAVDEQDFHEFYERWNASVYSFCRMFLGADEPAEIATQEAFVNYVREKESLATDQLPRRLFRNAVAESIRLDGGETRFPATEELGDVLPLLAPTDRAIFILRSVLDINMRDTADILQMSVERVNEGWLKASLFLRDLWLKKK